MCRVVLGLGNEYSTERGCLFSRVLQRIIFRQSFMHSSHSSHLLGKICCVHSFQESSFSWCPFQARVKDINKKCLNKLIPLLKTFIFLDVQGNPKSKNCNLIILVSYWTGFAQGIFRRKVLYGRFNLILYSKCEKSRSSEDHNHLCGYNESEQSHLFKAIYWNYWANESDVQNKPKFDHVVPETNLWIAESPRFGVWNYQSTNIL